MFISQKPREVLTPFIFVLSRECFDHVLFEGFFHLPLMKLFARHVQDRETFVESDQFPPVFFRDPGKPKILNDLCIVGNYIFLNTEKETVGRSKSLISS